MGNMLTLRPDLFRAVVCQVPLLDMRRYTKLLAGASWAAEYGDPDDPEQWKYIQTFSAYQNVQPQVKYPRTLFTTSTRDDRVHPGHARKMVAKMQEQGHNVVYYENIEGGHGVRSRQQAGGVHVGPGVHVSAEGIGEVAFSRQPSAFSFQLSARENSRLASKTSLRHFVE